jgi:hypothetical protein
MGSVRFRLFRRYSESTLVAKFPLPGQCSQALVNAANESSLLPFVYTSERASRSPRYKGVGNCSESCTDHLEFCGTDGECHAYSCEAWYRWGPPEYTGHILGNAIRWLQYQMETWR